MFVHVHHCTFCCRNCVMLSGPGDIKYRKNPVAESLAEAIGRVTWLDYDMTCCRYFLMPWVKSTKFMLFVLDHNYKKITWIDPTLTPEWCKDMPYKK
ncbi:hypothetical protein PVAP13_4KG392300 [Panicum virgatum]|uniref:Uncharacterized protein n=1 Tax=Panicum virgatum TaxID=38727 RepID=A0A8T0TX58_PANVG|nr:hypothetical protein PVAP13_4KG392300 [Panicum virgatum]